MPPHQTADGPSGDRLTLVTLHVHSACSLAPQHHTHPHPTLNMDISMVQPQQFSTPAHAATTPRADTTTDLSDLGDTTTDLGKRLHPCGLILTWENWL